jgi:dodecin
MEESTYIVTEVVGTSTVSWEDAAKTAIETASHKLEDLRVAEVVKQDVVVDVGRTTHFSTISHFRIRLKVSFKYHPGWEKTIDDM